MSAVSSHKASIHTINVRRQKLTLFLYIEPQDTVKALKEKILQQININPKPSQIASSPDAPDRTTDDIQLRYPADVVLEDDKFLADYELDDEKCQTVILLYVDSNGNIEPIDLHDPEPKGVPQEQMTALRVKHGREQPASSSSSSAAASSVPDDEPAQ